MQSAHWVYCATSATPRRDARSHTVRRAELVDVERDAAVAVCIEPLPQLGRVLLHRRHVVQIRVEAHRVHRADRRQVLLGCVECDGARVEHSAYDRLGGRIDLVKRCARRLVHLGVIGRVRVMKRCLVSRLRRRDIGLVADLVAFHGQVGKLWVLCPE